MEKVVHITQLQDKQTDFQYWQGKSYLERLNALEMLRTQYINFLNDVEPRLQRVCKVINRLQG
jgi:hypothetical protein